MLLSVSGGAAQAQSISCTAGFCGSDNASWTTGASNGGTGQTGGIASVQNNGVLGWALYATSSGGTGATGEDNTFETGGTGGAGGIATATNAGTLTTPGDLNKSGLNAFAEGGAGGMGGTSTFGPDGNSGNGGSGGTANAINLFGAVINQWAVGAGIYATADGGAGGDNQSQTWPGAGGAGGVVNITNGGTVSTFADTSDAIWATAYGGAGGSGNPSSGAGNVGGDGGVGGTVNILNTGSITAIGASSSAMGGSAAGGAGGVGGSSSAANGSNGGAGGEGGAVNLLSTGSLFVSGANAFGMLALTTGGAGGAGGTSDFISGGGAAGGAAGAITVTASGTITATGASSSAIGAFADGGAGGTTSDNSVNSFGGNGGLGGMVNLTLGLSASPGGFTTTGDTAPAVMVTANGGAGGNGNGSTAGNGGNGNFASLAITGVLATSGGSSHAVEVQSNGGAGGAASENAAGGSGGDGWAASVVLGNSAGAATSVSTQGGSAYAVNAQALGAAGGAGGTDTQSTSLTGYNGGAGGNGGTIYIGTWSNTQITTAGAGATALYALSQGGTGGAGGTMDGVGTSGAGGAGGGANYVAVQLGGQSVINTAGDNAYGVFAESSGGSGGEGASATAGLSTTGGAGGAGGGPMTWNSAVTPYQVTVTNWGTALGTSGDYAFGIFAVANGGLGGGGGDGGSGDFRTGGASGAAGAGGNILVQLNGGSITTSGYEAFGVVASSIGGGGGNGGSADGWCLAICSSTGGTATAGGNGGAVVVNNAGLINTIGTGAAGILALSVGGAGGNGGQASGTAASVGPTMSVSIGGNGGPGGEGGAVTVTNTGTISTESMDAPGLLAQSIGGGGGGGGQANANAFSVGAYDVPAIGLTVAVGGTGGTAGDGNTVTVDNSGLISTLDSQSAAIAAYSIGGGGGTGANASASSYTYGNTPSVSVATAVGGNGGGGGQGGAITVSNSGTLFTNGFSADGILAMSVGGGGGNGGVGAAVVSTSLPASTGVVSDLPLDVGKSGALSVAVGGQGGGGGDGGAVNLTNSGTITTLGTDARGILAQSVGGGGGTGAAGKGTGADTYTVHVSVGGSGGAGGAGGAITVTNAASGTISTNADGGHGIYAQSVGGGGGIAGTSTTDTADSFFDSTVGHETVAGTMYALKAWLATATSAFGQKLSSFAGKAEWAPVSVSANVSVGGTGGAGGDGGAVTLTNAGAVTTQGDVAFGLFGQSIGGGGGAGGAASVPGGAIVNTGVGIGGSGGVVSLTNSGTLVTSGNSSFGMIGQSIGGGGGIGGLATDPQTLSIELDTTVGGANFTGAGLDGGTITLINGGSIITGGGESHAVVAQSVGGGGGIFYLNQGTTQNIPSSNTGLSDQVSAAVGAISTQMADVQASIQSSLDALGLTASEAAAALQQQIDTAAGVMTFTLGATGTSAGFNSGAAVTVTEAGSILTTGNGAIGILAQSIGGGGGLATDGAGTIASLALAKSGNTIGGSIGNGGAVTVTLFGGTGITTQGDGATGILAQSIGGGGGYTGQWDANFQYTGLMGGPMGIGTGGVVTIATVVDPNAPGAVPTISTTGASAHGIFAQSLNNGGVAVADSLGIIVPTASGNSLRSAASAENQQAAMIETAFSPSLASPASGVAINYTGNIFTTGANSVGIFAQNGTQGTSGAILTNAQVAPTGNIVIDYTGTLQGGGQGGAAIWIDGGVSNAITLNPGSTVSALSEQAIVATGGSVALSNGGTLWGGVDLSGAGAGSSFVNTGTLYSGGQTSNGNLLLGSAILQNAGILNSGGPQATLTTSITGSVNQTPAGTLMVDIDTSSSQPADLISVSQTMQLNGSVQFNPLNALLPGSYTFLKAAGGLSANAAIVPSPLGVMSWYVNSDLPTPASSTVIAANGAVQLSVSPQANFQPAGVSLTPSEQSLAQHLQSSWTNVDVTMAPTFAALATIPTLAGYEAQMDSLSAEENSMPAVTQTLNTKASMNASLSCPAFVGSGTLMQETNCAWARIIASRTSQSTTGSVNGYTVDALTYRIGLQREISDGWFFGGTLGLTDSSFDPDNGYSSIDGLSGDAALSLKRQLGPWLLSMTGHLGYGSYDNDRAIFLGNQSWRAESSSSVFTAGGRLRAAYEFAFPDWYVKPYVDADLIYTHMPGYSESGGGGLGLDIGAMDEWTFGFSPNVEIGARFDLGGGYWLRPYGSVGMTLLSNDSLSVETHLQGVGAAVPGYTSSLQVPDTLVDLGAGLQLYNTAGYELRGEYRAQLGSDFVSQELGARLSIRF